jgi:ribosome-associated protein
MVETLVPHAVAVKQHRRSSHNGGMRDLLVPAGPGLPEGLVVPAVELVERFSKSPGPGGQSVNTTDSRVELELDVAASTAFTDAQRARALSSTTLRPWPSGRITVAASEHRSQHRNRVAARERLADLLREALAPPPPPRRPTRPSRGAKERRLKAKKERGSTKALRGRVRDRDQQP